MGTKRIIGLNATTDFESDDNIVVDSTTAGTRKMAQSVLKEKLRDSTLSDIHNLTPATDFATGDTIVVDNANDGPRGMDKDVLLAKTAQNALGSIHNLTTTITAFRTGDVIPVDGPSGTAKMAKEDLLKETAENAVGSIHLLSDTATEADLVSGNYFALDGSEGTKKLNADSVSSVTAIANKFNPARPSTYGVNELVMHNGKLYKFVTPHPTGEWIGTDVIEVRVTAEYLRLYLAEYLALGLAPKFDTSVNYKKGELVVSSWKLKKFTQDHPAGAWDSSHAKDYSFSDFLKEIGTEIAPYIYGMNFEWEKGNVTMSDSGWVYDTEHSDQFRARMKEGTYPYLKAGYKITLSSFRGVGSSYLRFFVGYLKNNGNYGSSGTWQTDEYTCPKDGFYNILLNYVSPAPASANMRDITEKLVIKDENGIVLVEAQKVRENRQDIKRDESFIFNDWEIGNVDYGTWIWQPSTKRICMQKDKFIRLYPGDEIFLSDYTNASFYVGWKYDDGTSDKQGWNSSTFVVSDEANYSILVRRSDGKDLLNKNWLLSLVRIKRAGKLLSCLDALQIQCNMNSRPLWQDDKNGAVKSIAHRGYSDECPENTLVSFRRARQVGFGYVETDVRKTSDGYWVCIHDATIDRTSNGTGNVADKTLAELKALDFGSWKDAKYAGEQIPTLEEFLDCCRALNVDCYVELKAVANKTELTEIVSIIKAHGMGDHTTLIGFATYGQWLYRDHVWDEARLGAVYNNFDPTNEYWTIMQGWLNDGHKVFYDLAVCSDSDVATLSAAGMPVERWSIYSNSNVINLNPYVSGVTSNFIIVSKVLCDNEIFKSALQ